MGVVELDECTDQSSVATGGWADEFHLADERSPTSSISLHRKPEMMASLFGRRYSGLMGSTKNVKQWVDNLCFGLVLFVVGFTLAVLLLGGKLFGDDSFPSNGFQLRHVSRLGHKLNGGSGMVMAPVRFSDIRGMEEVKLELMEVVEFFRNPSKYTQLGARMPKGVLMEGKPGTGKTMLAKAVATESNVTSFIFASGSEFVEVYVGQGAKRVRDLFSFARRNLPAIIFIDELDALGSRRGGHLYGGGGHKEADQTLNQLLVEMDGFTPSSSEPLIVLGATNRINVLDSALTRAHRFDKIVHIHLPDVAARQEILRHYLKGVTSDKRLVAEASKAVKRVARATSGFSGADLSNVVNEAALLAARYNSSLVREHHLTAARDKIAVGPERRSLTMTDSQRRITAFHEAGHALVAYRLQPDADPILKASILPRGDSLGHVEQIPLEDRYTLKMSEATARVAVSMAGRVAEEQIFGRHAISSGASSDFRHATLLAQRMVFEWGMSQKIGPYHYPLPSTASMPSGVMSERLARELDEEVRRILSEGYATATEIIKKDMIALRSIAEALLLLESLDSTQIENLVNTSHIQ